MNNREYWDRKIIEWENSMSQKEEVPFIERLASLFRRALKHRAEISLNILNDFIKDKSVLEIGCGSGYFAQKLIEQCKIKHITGIDISRYAVERARKISAERQLTDKCAFIEGDVNSVTLPETDVTIGLGVLDYLSPEDIKSLFKNMKSPFFLFTFAEKKVSLSRYFHICYMFSQGCSKHYYYTKNDISGFIDKKFCKVQFVNDYKISFGCIVHNLP